MTHMKISKEASKMAKKYVKKRKKQQNSGTTASMAGTTAGHLTTTLQQQKTQAAVLPPPPGPVVPLEVPLKLPASPKMLLDPQRYLPGINHVLPPASKIIKLQVAAVLPPLVSGTTDPFRGGTTATHKRYYRWHTSISG